jgi:hypothetical protein
MVLMIAAGFIVWHSSDSTAATSALQDQIETLAQLSGF